MKKKQYKYARFGSCMLGSFVLWTILVRCVDVQAIGPNSSMVGFAALNHFIHQFIGVNMALYVITDWLGLVPVCLMLGFAILGLVQWIRRKRILEVDRDILALGGFYLVVAAVFLFFEQFVVNYRPVLIDGCLEASYPSSTPLLVLTVMPTAMMQLYSRIRNPVFRRGAMLTISVLIAFMIIARFFSGVHWMTDIVGGILLSGSLVMLYAFVIGSEEGNHTDES